MEWWIPVSFLLTGNGSYLFIKPGGYPSVSHRMITFKYLATSIFGIVCSQSKVQAVFVFFFPLASGNCAVVISSVEGVPKAACLPQFWGLSTSQSSSVWRGAICTRDDLRCPFSIFSESLFLSSTQRIKARLGSRQSPVAAPFPGLRPFSPS